MKGETMLNALKLLQRMVDVTAAALLLALGMVLLIGIFFRYCLHAPLFWSDGLATHLFTWFLFMGLPIAVRRNSMFKVEILDAAFPEWARRPNRILCSILCIIVYCVVAYYGWELTKMQQAMIVSIFPSLFPFVSFAWVYFSIPVAFAITAIEELYLLIQMLLGIEHERGAIFH